LILTLAFAFTSAPAQTPPTSQPVRPRPPSLPPPDEEEDKPAETPLRKLTEEEIWRIRFLELRGIRQGRDVMPESITVKIDNKLVDEFLTLMEGNPDYSGERARAEFRKRTSAQKAHLIAAERGVEFADKVHITSDPEVFVEFRKRVMPTILRGCATTGCHGPAGGEDVKFHLFRDPKKAADTTYANFVILNDLQVGGLPLINRSQPSNSLLLTYMLPTKDVKPEMRHPVLKAESDRASEEIKPLFQNRAVADFRRIENWIASLKHPAEDYRVHLLARPAPPAPSPERDVAPP
jgi:hypothetical protein